MPTVKSGVLYTENPETTGIRIDSFEWSAWLEDNASFYYQVDQGSFTARKYRQHQSFYWFAFKRIQGRLHKRYLGMREKITAARLNVIASQFAADNQK